MSIEAESCAPRGQRIVRIDQTWINVEEVAAVRPGSMNSTVVYLRSGRRVRVSVLDADEVAMALWAPEEE